jgi:CheY-like chemotaxis protein
VSLLLVDDDPGDVRLLREALREAGVQAELVSAGNADEALMRLLRQGPYAGVPRPDLVLLDLNLPRTSGRELLRLLKSDARLRRVPVVVLTTSSAEEDVLECYDLHANGYVTKPMDLDRLVEVVRSICEFWLKTARLPPGE